MQRFAWRTQSDFDDHTEWIMPTLSSPRAPWRSTTPAPQHPVAAMTHHEHLEDHHLALAHQLHEALRRPLDPTPVAALAQMTRVVDAAERELAGALRQAEILRQSLTDEQQQSLAKAVDLLTRAHDAAWRSLQKARLQLLDGEMVELRVQLARVFSEVGRAEHAHHYLRTAHGVGV